MGDDALPILSSRSEDPDLGEAIDAFVLGLAERIDALQDAEAKQDLTLVQSQARRLIADAEATGFTPLARCAAVIEAACEEESAPDVLRALVELTDLARRVRAGHRGALP